MPIGGKRPGGRVKRKTVKPRDKSRGVPPWYEDRADYDLELLNQIYWDKCLKLAESFGFTVPDLNHGHGINFDSDFSFLVMLAAPEGFKNMKISDADKLRCLDLLSEKPDAAFQVILAVRAMNKKFKDNPIIDTLLSFDHESGDFFYKLPIKTIAAEALRRLGQKYTGDRLDDFVESVKQARLYLRKRVAAL
jgi:hypothetical protein